MNTVSENHQTLPAALGGGQISHPALYPHPHPHPDPMHVMRRYRGHILGCKRKWGSARGLTHYRAYVEMYLAAKRKVLA